MDNYEKKYKNALEWARKVMQGKVGFVLDDVLEVFPELKESGDERMVKFIKNQLFNIKKIITENYELDAKLTNAIDWLEKQGEQKPADKVEPKFKVGDIVKHKDNPHLTYILKRFTDDGNYEFHAIGKDGHEGCTCISVVKYQDKWELVEQKTVEN